MTHDNDDGDEITDELKAHTNDELRHNAQIVLQTLAALDRGAARNGLDGDVQATMHGRMLRLAMLALAERIALDIERRVAEERAQVAANARETNGGCDVHAN